MSTNNSISSLKSDQALISVGRSCFSFAKKHYILTSVYIACIIAAGLASGVSVDSMSAEFFEAKMMQAATVTANDMTVAMEAVRYADSKYYRSKGWFSCDPICTRNYQQLLVAQERLELIRVKRDLLEVEAKSVVGPWSVFGVAELRKAFWSAWEHGKEAARRMTMFDAIFIGLSSLGGSSFDDRDSSFFLTVLQIATQFVLNLTLGLVAALFTFMMDSWIIITSYGPTFMSGISLFIVTTMTAFAVISTAIGGLVGGLMGTVYVAVRSAEKRARINEPRRLHLE